MTAYNCMVLTVLRYRLVQDKRNAIKIVVFDIAAVCC